MLFNGIEIVAVTACCVAASIHCVHTFQMERYQLPVYSQWLRRNQERFLKRNVAVGFVASLLSWYLPIFFSLFIAVEETRASIAHWTALICFIAVTVILAVREFQEPTRKPMALTARAKRLFLMVALLNAAVALVLSLVSIPPYVAYAAVPYSVWTAGRILDPVEKHINAGFYEEARKKLRARNDLIKIGITGSYGKTLTKFILREILSQKYEVLATPASFNTAMGISRVVNDQLESRHQVFIAEMGAQHVGDIRHLVKLVGPQYGMITSIGPQHLDSFGSMANIADGKNELIEGLPENGVAFFASDCGYTDRLYAKCKSEKYNAAVEQPGEYYMKATEVSFGAKGTQFLLTCSDGGSVRCRTRLLGRYNVQNIALASALARRLGLTMEEIAEGISRLQPFEKKLQLIPGQRTVIDDTLNAHPAGAAEALDVLAEFPGRRIVITPGLPDVGSRGEEQNFAFGAQMKDCVDAVILVGDRQSVRPIARGVLSTGFPKTALHVVADMSIAQDLLEEISGDGDTVLYECSQEN